MTNIKVIILAIWVTCGLSAPTTTWTSCDGFGRCTTGHRAATTTSPDDELFTFFAVVLLIIVVPALCCARCFCKRRNSNRSCSYYTNVKNTTVETVYGQLRRKWKTIDQSKVQHLANSELTPAVLLNDAKMRTIRKLMAEIDTQSALCSKYFASEKFEGLNITNKTMSIATYFEQECAVIELLSNKVIQLRKTLPLRKKNSLF